MEVLNYQHEHKRYIDLDYNYKFLGEVFRVDDLLDFTNEEISPPIVKEEHGSAKHEDFSAKLAEPPSLAEEVGSKDDLELIGMHCEDIPELEWLSNFVDDNSSIDETAAEAAAKFAAASGCSTVYPFKNSSGGEFKEYKEFKGESIQEEASDDPASGLESSSNNSDKDRYMNLGSVPGRARTRTKRSRTKCTEVSSTTSEGSLPEVQQCCSSSFSAESEEYPEYVPRPTKKACNVKAGSRQKSVEKEGYIQKCLHCGSQKTPQWRTGPLGPKTLCNACGVRFKSGRLFPEYRPAASPSFVPQKHSNSHKKVLEMRRMKESGYSAKLTVSSTTTVTDDEEEEY